MDTQTATQSKPADDDDDKRHAADCACCNCDPYGTRHIIGVNVFPRARA